MKPGTVVRRAQPEDWAPLGERLENVGTCHSKVDRGEDVIQRWETCYGLLVRYPGGKIACKSCGAVP